MGSISLLSILSHTSFVMISKSVLECVCASYEKERKYNTKKKEKYSFLKNQSIILFLDLNLKENLDLLKKFFLHFKLPQRKPENPK